MSTVSAAPALPIAVIEKSEIQPLPPLPSLLFVYTLYYRHGSNTSCFKLFEFKGDLAGASQRGRTHCELMGFVFIYVKPFLSNLDAEEKRRLRNLGDPL